MHLISRFYWNSTTHILPWACAPRSCSAPAFCAIGALSRAHPLCGRAECTALCAEAEGSTGDGMSREMRFILHMNLEAVAEACLLPYWEGEGKPPCNIPDTISWRKTPSISKWQAVNQIITAWSYMLPGSYIMAQNSSASAAALRLKYSKKGSDESGSPRFHWKHNSRFPISALKCWLRNQEKKRNNSNRQENESQCLHKNIENHNSMFVYITPGISLTKQKFKRHSLDHGNLP